MCIVNVSRIDSSLFPRATLNEAVEKAHSMQTPLSYFQRSHLYREIVVIYRARLYGEFFTFKSQLRNKNGSLSSHYRLNQFLN
ncbi:hypothetical protein SAMN05421510_10897 [Nitrosomonas ureae]|uniref:Uncharacterized protein n=1 Tax=Nitrosomonas ureae TaxID=44577 RepID=A0A1H9H5F2_9PROT|nr:hypothetical protein C8R28_10812 [Nitrosomonas ureae]SEQ57556.1 hypothetical protein SAMN05421510_10897 [Nitrosomonas ureae]